LPGRAANQLLVTFTGDAVQLNDASMWDHDDTIYSGYDWYHNIKLCIATPDVGWPIAVGIEQVVGWEKTWAIHVANGATDYGEWSPGVHLFSVTIWMDSVGPTSDWASTFATAIIEPKPDWSMKAPFTKQAWQYMQLKRGSRRS
jgi:hypothetical protein